MIISSSPLLSVPQILSALLFSFSLHGCCICICIYKYLPKYSPLHLYNATHTNVFRADRLVLCNQSVCSSLGKTMSPTLSLPYLPVVLRVGLRPCALFLFHFSMFITVLLGLMFWQPCWWGFMAIISDIIRRHSLTANSLFLWLRHSFQTPLQCSPSLRSGGCFRRFHRHWALHFGWLWCLQCSPSLAKRSFLDEDRGCLRLWSGGKSSPAARTFQMWRERVVTDLGKALRLMVVDF